MDNILTLLQDDYDCEGHTTKDYDLNNPTEREDAVFEIIYRDASIVKYLDPSLDVLGKETYEIYKSIMDKLEAEKKKRSDSQIKAWIKRRAKKLYKDINDKH